MKSVSSLLEIRDLTVEFPQPGTRAGAGSALAGGAARAPRPNLPSGAAVAAAVRELSLTIAPGEVLGLVGESGSGKSVTSLALMRLLPPHALVSGELQFADGGGCMRDLLRISSEEMRQLRGSAMAMIFQEPMTALNPVMRVGDQIAEAILAHRRAQGVSRKEAWNLAVQALQDVAIPDAARRARDYPYQLSGGMRQRVMIAMAIANRPKLLIADEPTTALDVTIQAQILQLLAELRQKFGLAMLFISHDLAVVSQIADRTAVMYAGNLVELGTKSDIFCSAAHPYTRGLLQAVPTLKTDRGRPLSTIEGNVPPLQALLAGCPFEPRCQWRVPQCARELPELIEIAPGHWARCPVVKE
jgi:peptide/nickel transport system ATP-binding protein